MNVVLKVFMYLVYSYLHNILGDDHSVHRTGTEVSQEQTDKDEDSEHIAPGSQCLWSILQGGLSHFRERHLRSPGLLIQHVGAFDL